MALLQNNFLNNLRANLNRFTQQNNQLDADHPDENLRQSINNVSGGKITVDKSINNLDELSRLYNTVQKVFNFNSNLEPSHSTLTDPTPGSGKISGAVGATYMDHYGNKKDPLPIHLYNADYPEIAQNMSQDAKDSGWWTVGASNGDGVALHELGHAVSHGYSSAPSRWAEAIAKDASQYKGKYKTSDIIEDAASKLPYAIPKLVDKIFGTHIVPTKQEYLEMEEGPAVKFWANNFKSLEDKKDIASELTKQAAQVRNDWKKTRDKNRDNIPDLFYKAAKSSGFDTLDDAMASISEYGSTDVQEAFAEAYSDVIENKQNAKPFSKEIMKQVSDAADKYAGKKNKTLSGELLYNLSGVIDKNWLDSPSINEKAPQRKLLSTIEHELRRQRTRIDKNTSGVQ